MKSPVVSRRYYSLCYCYSLFLVGLPRCVECRRGLAMRIRSVCMSNASIVPKQNKDLSRSDQWCLRHNKILRIPYTAHVTNDEVRRRTCQPPATHRITTRLLRLFGHIARAGPSQDHSRALQAAISCLPVDWHRPPGRPR